MKHKCIIVGVDVWYDYYFSWNVKRLFLKQLSRLVQLSSPRFRTTRQHYVVIVLVSLVLLFLVISLKLVLPVKALLLCAHCCYLLCRNDMLCSVNLYIFRKRLSPWLNIGSTLHTKNRHGRLREQHQICCLLELRGSLRRRQVHTFTWDVQRNGRWL